MTTSVQFSPATIRDAAELARTMRPEDAAEVAASNGVTALWSIVHSMQASEVSYAVRFDGVVACMFGVGPSLGYASLLGKPAEGTPWFLTGTEVLKRPRALIGCAKRGLHMLLDYYPMLHNMIDARYLAAVRFAKWLGFTVEDPVPFGVLGLPFHHASLRRPAWE